MTDKAAFQVAQDELQETRLNREVHHFFERWTPEDPREAAEFQMAFHSVTRAIYADMQRPVNAALESCLRIASVQPVFISKKDTP
ncbi:hypothetical protein JQV19_08320 [Sulfitobacter mediterraneus]|uniref:hypothetical protein n=1 Tax=Sulfitobacter mediterraneus TaxID=83219 RepID=UPI001939E479|nr:hypothetical protein [Sulfitobacter mediterraneus]MBM1556651.1 hypothetical protein [Sulfitobacter mediterraneus]MBM1570153.1 hypothetical protein [Sulfitobacter mediterraneus]MBM1574109.1 hypothetical protein [Sulfitobacter mediterraneus]MBM1577895.1 hypothetical protein [Sulfitobacter mediterraneus]MBM1579609.1 hypothetical protein [Sulfitobacter mediterraneus]